MYLIIGPRSTGVEEKARNAAPTAGATCLLPVVSAVSLEEMKTQ